MKLLVLAALLAVCPLAAHAYGAPRLLRLVGLPSAPTRPRRGGGARLHTQPARSPCLPSPLHVHPAVGNAPSRGSRIDWTTIEQCFVLVAGGGAPTPKCLTAAATPVGA